MEAIIDGGFGERDVDEPSWRPLTKLLAFVGKRDFDDSGNMARRSLNADRVRGDQLNGRRKGEYRVIINFTRARVMRQNLIYIKKFRN